MIIKDNKFLFLLRKQSNSFFFIHEHDIVPDVKNEIFERKGEYNTRRDV